MTNTVSPPFYDDITNLTHATEKAHKRMQAVYKELHDIVRIGAPVVYHRHDVDELTFDKQTAHAWVAAGCMDVKMYTFDDTPRIGSHTANKAIFYPRNNMLVTPHQVEMREAFAEYTRLFTAYKECKAAIIERLRSCDTAVVYAATPHRLSLEPIPGDAHVFPLGKFADSDVWRAYRSTYLRDAFNPPSMGYLCEYMK